MRTSALIAAALLAVACSSSADSPNSTPITAAPTPSSTPSDPPETAVPAPVETGDEAVPVTDGPVDPGVRRIEPSAWAVDEMTVEFPDGWTVSSGNVFLKHSDQPDEVMFSAVVVDDIFADACAGEERSIEVGASAADLAVALAGQAGPVASRPTETTIGGLPALRVDLSVPADLDLDGPAPWSCRIDGLQLWFADATDQYTVLAADGIASVYVVEIDGRRQVFVAQHRTGTSAADVAELEDVLASIRFVSAPPEPVEPEQSSRLKMLPTVTAGIEPGTYFVPRSEWTDVDFTVTFPPGWTAQYGHVFQKYYDSNDEFGFYAVVVDEIHADACAGTSGEAMSVGPTAEDLAVALTNQAGTEASGVDVDESVGGNAARFGPYDAIQVTLSVPDDLDLASCNIGDIGLQIWYSAPADKHFVLLPDGTAIVWIVDVDGRRLVFVIQLRDGMLPADLDELVEILDSIRIMP